MNRYFHLAEQQAHLLRALSTDSLQDAIEIIAAGALFTPLNGIFDFKISQNQQQNQWQRGLAAYRANAHAIAQRALSAAYPVVAQIIGAEAFAQLAQAFWHACAPGRGDLAQWGAQLPDFIAQAAQLQELPYLGDVARIEWAVHVCASAPDALQDTASLNGLTQHAPSMLALQLAPGCAVLASDWPAASIWLAHQAPPQGVSLETAVALVQRGEGQTAMVWREGFVPRVCVLAQAERVFVQAVLDQTDLEEALNRAGGRFDFAVWLARAVQTGQLLSVRSRTTAR